VRVLAGDDLIAFVATGDPARARAFYGDTLGLELVEETPFAVVFSVGATMLRVTVVDAVIAAPYTVLGWAVADIAARVRELGKRGVAFERYAGLEQDELGVWRSPSGARIAWFKDPDGNTLSLTQP
jgi:catechol 2,3-dioxygenase-like lactoylglutathione lyase family enzyme